MHILYNALMKKIKTRFALSTDLNQLVELSTLFDKYFSMLDNAALESNLSEKKQQIKKLNFSKNPLMRTLVAVLGENIIGAVSFYKGFTVDTGEVYHLPYFLIRPEYRGSKTALHLFNALKKAAAKEKIHFFVFSVYGKNKSASKLYEHAGAKYWADDDEHFMYLKI